MKNYFAVKAVLAGAAAFLAAPSFASDDLAVWKSGAHKQMTAKLRYPKDALDHNIEGAARVRLIIAADGTIVGHEVIKPSGEPLLDREILNYLGRINPLPALPDGQTEMSLIMPLSWNVKELGYH